MEKDKVLTLKKGKGSFETVVYFSDETKREMRWWKDNVMSSCNDVDVSHGDPDFVLFTDASLTGWGCACDLGRTGGHWDHTAAQDSINVLELKAGLIALK